MPSPHERLAPPLRFTATDRSEPLSWLETATAVFVGVLAALIAFAILTPFFAGLLANAYFSTILP